MVVRGLMVRESWRNSSRSYRRRHFELDEVIRKARGTDPTRTDLGTDKLDSGLREHPKRVRAVPTSNLREARRKRVLRITEETTDGSVTSRSETVVSFAFVAAFGTYVVLWAVGAIGMIFPQSPIEDIYMGIWAPIGDALNEFGVFFGLAIVFITLFLLLIMLVEKD